MAIVLGLEAVRLTISEKRYGEGRCQNYKFPNVEFPVVLSKSIVIGKTIAR